ncbi:lysine-specific demethylase 4D-like [Paramacrobiotus metropolitanus]|uniref:lysine-specific demethylase 4D-like n=1 Tax=Paramacrobiotus metropolitanus TaxID=2943436 RepID=UPI0024456841|nr:lysine-specific demethylase 4D-like [Paramacrobiotus metropolitanus]
MSRTRSKRSKRKVPLDAEDEDSSSRVKSSKVLRIEEAPIFEPTWEEFQDMPCFLHREDVKEAGMRCGIIKIVCPPTWQPVDNSAVQRLTSVPVVTQTFEQKCDGCYYFYRDEPEEINLGVWGRRVAENDEVIDEEWRDICKGKTKSAFSDKTEKYWSTLLSQRAQYAADVSGSLMRKELEHWNLGSGNLHCLTQNLGREERNIPGVTSPYLYFGAFGTTFGYHTEDADLYSINYLVEGSPKEWTAVPAAYGEKLENVVKKLFQYGPDKCPAFMREKSHVIRPDVLLKEGVPVYRASQGKHQIIVTFPYAYHGGFNSGDNVAEARNVALSDWIPYGLAARSCTCGKCTYPNPMPKTLVEKIARKTDHPEYYKYKEFGKKFADGAPYPHPNQKS